MHLWLNILNLLMSFHYLVHDIALYNEITKKKVYICIN